MRLMREVSLNRSYFKRLSPAEQRVFLDKMMSPSRRSNMDMNEQLTQTEKNLAKARCLLEEIRAELDGLSLKIPTERGPGDVVYYGGYAYVIQKVSQIAGAPDTARKAEMTKVYDPLVRMVASESTLRTSESRPVRLVYHAG